MKNEALRLAKFRSRQEISMQKSQRWGSQEKRDLINWVNLWRFCWRYMTSHKENTFFEAMEETILCKPAVQHVEGAASPAL